MKLFSITTFFTLFLTIANANNTYILKHDGLIDARAQEKILQIGTEVKSKLNANLYVFIIENNGINPNISRDERKKMMDQFEKSITDGLQKPYGVLLLVIDQLHANLLMSEEIAKILDKDDILDSYVIPLLASKDKNTLFAKTSAAALNGYAQMADSIADSQNIELVSSIGSGGKVASTVWKIFMYTLVLGGIILYAIVIMREKKYKKKKALEDEHKRG